MTAYLPTSATAVLYVIAGLGIIVWPGYLLFRVHSKSVSRLVAWGMAVCMMLATHWVMQEEPPGFRMLAIIALLFTSMKLVVANEFSLAGQKLTFKQWIAFALGWFGMNPAVFMRRQPQKKASGKPLILFGLSRMAMGLLMILFAWWLGNNHILTGWMEEGVISLLMLVGLSLMLHFGLLNINSGIWNLAAIGAYPLFRSPLRSESLNEFWGKRWNIAFSEMTSIALYRPLRKKIGEQPARYIAFGYSGILHELAISLPVNAGYGLPMMYFLLQAIALYAETRIPFPSKMAKHGWVLLWLLVCFRMLFV
jgi:alginate O-acetyltransferase complex protein AlgI